MQQLLRAPPAWTLSLNAALTYDCLTFIAAKTAVGDASALTDCPNSIKYIFPPTLSSFKFWFLFQHPILNTMINYYEFGTFRISEKVEVYLKNGDVLPTKLVEDITSKMRTLEDNIVRYVSPAQISLKFSLLGIKETLNLSKICAESWGTCCLMQIREDIITSFRREVRAPRAGKVQGDKPIRRVPCSSPTN